MAEVLATYTYTLIDSGTHYEIVCSNKSTCTKAVIPNEYDGKPVTSIGNEAFSDCSTLTSIDISDNITSIGNRAFYYCSKLTSVTIPDSVTSIGYYAFYKCSSLASVTVKATIPPTLGSNLFYTASECPIYVPAQSIDVYKTALNWSRYASRIQAIPSLRKKIFKINNQVVGKLNSHYVATVNDVDVICGKVASGD